MAQRRQIPAIARVLGFAGLLPQAAAVAVLVLGPPELQSAALGLAYAYALLIFSFLGGVWWGLGAASYGVTGRGAAAPWVWIAAVLPSLIGLATAAPLAIRQTGVDRMLIVLGLFIAASLLVDLRLKAAGLTPDGWLALRIPLSLGLGLLTLAAGLI